MTGHVDPETQKLYTHWFARQARERMDRVPFEFNDGRGEKKLSKEKKRDGSMTAQERENLIAENRSLRAQVRVMQAEKERMDSLRKRIRILEKRLSEAGRN